MIRNKKKPGDDVFRSALLLISIVWLFFTIDRLPLAISEYMLTANKIISGIGAGLALLSIAQSRHLEVLQKNKRKNHIDMLFLPKLLISCSTAIFFMMLCAWVVILGGILDSPYSSLLTVSSIFIIFNALTSQDIEEFTALFESSDDSDEILFRRNIKIIKFLSYMPFVMVFITVIVFECYLLIEGRDAIMIMLLMESDVDKIITDFRETKWYVIVAYLTYYFALIGVLITLIPESIRTNILFLKFRG